MGDNHSHLFGRCCCLVAELGNYYFKQLRSQPIVFEPTELSPFFSTMLTTEKMVTFLLVI